MEHNTNFRCLGMEVEFPFNPYGIQKVMMNKMVATLTNKEHSLLESPTGTGKTLVLLCSSLAWQKKSKVNGKPFISAKFRQRLLEERREKLISKPCTCGKRTVINLDEIDEIKKAKGCTEFKEGKEYDDCMEIKEDKDLKESEYFKKDSDDFDDFDIEIIEVKEGKGCKDGKEFKENEFDEPSSKRMKTETKEKEFCISCQALEAEDKFAEVFGEDCAEIKAKVPRIYYGTRTHKQITQVIRELNKTPYKKGLRMCILSSRERTCINEQVREQSNRNDLCQELLKNNKSQENPNRKSSGEGCPFYKDSNTCATIYEDINIDYQDEAWDIENAAEYGKRNKCCPYFGTRSLQEQADITFSPYNYLLDPMIRKTMNINLNNSIVIFDEAHNIEDICRDSASFVIDTKQIDDILDTINIAASHYMPGSVIMDAYQFFRDKFLNLKSFLYRYVFPEPQKQQQPQYPPRGLGLDSLTKVKDNLKALKGDDDEAAEKPSNNEQESALSFAQLQFICQLCITLEFMYSNNQQHIDDFRGVVTRTLERFDPTRPGKGNRAIQNSEESKYVWQFSLVCMNPGIAFDKIHSLAWSVIVASGTLSPIESLKTELGCQFNNVFEGSHVISAERIFASIVSHGPNMKELNCGWQNSLSLPFQDEVGLVVRDVCTTVPHGILCFFPSYDRMENLYQRWFTIGIIPQIEKAGKKFFKEDRKSTPDKFEKELQKYNRLAKTKGAILFAVFRGKVSEGIDFANEAARAVITIGIPYPNVKETNVGLKREYNDIARRTRPHLMPGGDWYTAQAFRALNQALGRCIRHQEDWGAIIMIDSRLINQVNSVSRWLRRDLRTSENYPDMKKRLEKFIKLRTSDENDVTNSKNQQHGMNDEQPAFIDLDSSI